MNQKEGKCAGCPFKSNDRICRKVDGRAPENCSTLLYPEEVEASRAEMEQDTELMRFAKNASLQEISCYKKSPFDPNKFAPEKCRIQEVIEFAQRMGYQRLGFAFCIGLRSEAMQLNQILESHGFDVVSVSCKVGGTDKNFIGIPDEQKMRCGFETMCNPVAQALILNREKTQFNLMMGLCVGHDSMFLKYAQAPVTVVAVKDRVLGNNPLAALYCNYYKFLKK